MGSKNNPGKFDCYARAEPDEPMFVLLGRDSTAYVTVLLWCALRKQIDPDDPKIQEARECSAALEAWAIEHGKDTRAVLEVLEQVMRDYAARQSKEQTG